MDHRKMVFFFWLLDSNRVGSGEQLVSRFRKELETLGVQKVAAQPLEIPVPEPRKETGFYAGLFS